MRVSAAPKLKFQKPDTSVTLFVCSIDFGALASQAGAFYEFPQAAEGCRTAGNKLRDSVKSKC